MTGERRLGAWNTASDPPDTTPGLYAGADTSGLKMSAPAYGTGLRDIASHAHLPGRFLGVATPSGCGSAVPSPVSRPHLNLAARAEGAAPPPPIEAGHASTVAPPLVAVAGRLPVVASPSPGVATLSPNVAGASPSVAAPSPRVGGRTRRPAGLGGADATQAAFQSMHWPACRGSPRIVGKGALM